VKRTFQIRINGDLRGTPFVRVIASNGEMLGVMPLAEALRLALEKGLDLVEVNPAADPPVCKVLDFSKYKHDEKMKAAEARREPAEADASDDEALSKEARAHGLPNGPIPWKTFECDGRTFEWLSVPTRQKTTPRPWPAHKASPGAWVPVVCLIVRTPGDVTGPATLYPEGTVTTVEHAVETARRFWDHLTR
jgi:hypothetical protein